jgi:hypothetical protein
MASKDKIITIKKIEDIPVKPVEDPKLDGGKKKKQMKTYPKSSLKTAKVKIAPVTDPAKSPPLKKFMKRHTVRIMTNSGVHARRQTIKKKIDKMSDQKVRELVMKHGHSKGNAPLALLRQTLEGLMTAGFISSS